MIPSKHIQQDENRCSTVDIEVRSKSDTSEKRLHRRSSLLSCCSPTTNSSNNKAVDAPPTIRFSPLRIKQKSSDTFAVRRKSNSGIAAICQQNANQRFTLFCPRPLSPGQPPSLTMGGRILYRLGRVTVHSSERSTISLWNGKIVAVERHQSDGTVKLIQADDKIFAGFLNDSAKRLFDENCSKHNMNDELLVLCMARIFEKTNGSLSLGAVSQRPHIFPSSA